MLSRLSPTVLGAVVITGLLTLGSIAVTSMLTTCNHGLQLFIAAAIAASLGVSADSIFRGKLPGGRS